MRIEIVLGQGVEIPPDYLREVVGSMWAKMSAPKVGMLIFAIMKRL